MTRNYQIKIHDRQTDTYQQVTVPSDQYILHSAEACGLKLPFACRNGACTACAVLVKSGDLVQPEAMGLSPQLQRLEVETQSEDEVYELQFGQYFGKGKIKYGLPIEAD
jgi:ferredoxin